MEFVGDLCEFKIRQNNVVCAKNMSAIDSLCRTCMKNVIDNTEQSVCSCNIFGMDGLAEKLIQCSNIEIQPFDEYPTRVCHKCCNKIHEFCSFQEMCRESLEKFSKMLEKESKADRYVPKILGCHGSVVASKDHHTSIIGNEFDSDHEIKLEDNFTEKPRDTQCDILQIKCEYDFDESADTDPVTGTNDCDISEAIRTARCERMGKIINCEHDYSLCGQAAVLPPIVVGGDKDKDADDVIENEDERSLGYTNMLEIIGSVDETPLHLNPVSNKFNKIMLKKVPTNHEEHISEEIQLFEDLHVNEESFSEINVTASGTSAKTISVIACFNKTAVTNVADPSMENTFSHEVFLDEDKDPLFGDFSDESKINKADLDNIGLEIKEDNLFNYSSGDKQFQKTHFVDYNCENGEGSIFKNLSEDEENSKKRQQNVSKDEVNESHVFAVTASEDKEIYSDTGTVRSDRKPKQKRKRFSCDLCPQTFFLEQRLIAHKRRHQGLRGYLCSRENCECSYNSLIELRQHLDDHDRNSSKMYKCDYDDCGLQFTTKLGLDLHRRIYHKYTPEVPDRKYVCETCGTIFKYSRSLQIHQYIHVDQSLWPFKCEIAGCSKSFRSENFYIIHKNRHYGIKLYACTYCDKRFCSNANLQMHINYHTLAKKYACSFCPKICYTPQNVRKHIQNVHINIPDENPIDCEECGRSFKRACDLRVHKQTHMPKGPPKVRETVKNFYCSVCNKALANANNLKQHEKKHTEGKQFECDICGVKFSYRRNLHRHQQKNLCRTSKTTKDECPAKEDSIEALRHR